MYIHLYHDKKGDRANGNILLGVTKKRLLLFDIDGTLISTGGAGAKSWRCAFEQLFGVPADIETSSEAGMTDPDEWDRRAQDTAADDRLFVKPAYADRSPRKPRVTSAAAGIFPSCKAAPSSA